MSARYAIDNRWLRIYLLSIAAVHIIVGLLLVLSAFVPLSHHYLEYLYKVFSVTDATVAIKQMTKTLIALFGPTILSWGIFMYYLVKQTFRTASIRSCNTLLLSLISWFVLDSLISIMAGIYYHLAINLLVMLLLIPALILLRKRCQS